MKNFISAVVIGAALIAPMASFAQSNTSTTHATGDRNNSVNSSSVQGQAGTQNGTSQATNGDYGGSLDGNSKAGSSVPFSQAGCMDSGEHRNPLCYRN